MLTDALSNNGMKVPPIEGPDAERLRQELFSGSSVANPVDFLATGTAEQLGTIIDYVDNKFDNIDAMVVIFGTPGLSRIFDVYDVLHQKMLTTSKPLYPVLPSILTAREEVDYFLEKGHVNFPDEVVLGNALARVYHTAAPQQEQPERHATDYKEVRRIIASCETGYIAPGKIQALLDAAGISRAGEAVVASVDEAQQKARMLGFPVVMKVVGPLHKSDVGGVVLNVKDDEQVANEFNRMMKIPQTTSVLLQPMLSGQELFLGAKKEDKFGHMLFCGLGGIFVEVMKDVTSALTPVTLDEARGMIKRLRSYKMIQGTRGQEGVDEEQFAQMIWRLSALLEAAPEITEMDLNPLLGTPEEVVAVDARINIRK